MCIRDRVILDILLARPGRANPLMKGICFFPESAGADIGLFLSIAEELHPLVADWAACIGFHDHVLADVYKRQP